MYGAVSKFVETSFIYYQLKDCIIIEVDDLKLTEEIVNLAIITY